MEHPYGPLQKRYAGIFYFHIFCPIFGARKLKNGHFCHFSPFFTRLRAREIRKNQNFKISRITILDRPLGMIHTKFGPNPKKIQDLHTFFPKLTLKKGYIFYIRGFPYVFANPILLERLVFREKAIFFDSVKRL